MKFIALSTLVTLALAAPFQVSDISILQYALTLEHLENTFYRTALDKFKAEDFKAAGVSDFFYSNILRVASDEADHVKVLTGALADKAVPPCVYNFQFKTVQDFLNTASVLEGVGVSAYLGAAPDIESKAYLGVAASITTTEARHSAYIRGGKPNPQRPFAAPYDVSLNYRQVFSLAAGFIKSCPVDLGITGFPALTATGGATTGSTVTLTTTAKPTSDTPLYCGFTTPGVGATFVPAKQSAKGYECAVPKGSQGQTYVVLQAGATAPTAFSDDAVFAGPAIFEVDDSPKTSDVSA